MVVVECAMEGRAFGLRCLRGAFFFSCIVVWCWRVVFGVHFGSCPLHVVSLLLHTKAVKYHMFISLQLRCLYKTVIYALHASTQRPFKIKELCMRLNM